MYNKCFWGLDTEYSTVEAWLCKTIDYRTGTVLSTHFGGTGSYFMEKVFWGVPLISSPYCASRFTKFADGQMALHVVAKVTVN